MVTKYLALLYNNSFLTFLGCLSSLEDTRYGMLLSKRLWRAYALKRLGCFQANQCSLPPEGFSLPAVLQRKSVGSHNSNSWASHFWLKSVECFPTRHLCLSAAMNSYKSNFIRVGIFIPYHWLASTNWILYIQKWNKIDYAILKLWMVTAARRFVPHTVTISISQEETPMHGESASLIVKFKIKAHLNINS